MPQQVIQNFLSWAATVGVVDEEGMLRVEKSGQPVRAGLISHVTWGLPSKSLCGSVVDEEGMLRVEKPGQPVRAGLISHVTWGLPSKSLCGSAA
jgi:hypothetical protein